MAYIDLKRERSIIELVGGQEVILENLNHSTTEPIFRQNGYEVNGDKKSFALAFDSANSEYLHNDNYVYNGALFDFDFDIDVETDILGGSNVLISLYPTADNDSQSVSFYIGGYRMRATVFGTITSASTQEFLVNGKYNIKKVGAEIFVNDVLSITLPTNETLATTRLGVGFYARTTGVSAHYFNGEIKDFTINNDQFLFREGQGNKVYSENYVEGVSGSVATINTSFAGGSPSDYIDTQVWSESDDKWIDYKEE